MRRGTILAIGFLVAFTTPVRADDLPALSQLDAKARLAKAKVELAKANLEQTRERAAWAERMVKNGYLTPGQRQAELLKVAEALLALDQATAELAALSPSADDRTALGRLVWRVRQVKAEVELARSNLEQTRERAAWAARMVKQGYMSAVQQKADQARLVEAELALVKAEAALRAISPDGSVPKK